VLSISLRVFFSLFFSFSGLFVLSSQDIGRAKAIVLIISLCSNISPVFLSEINSIHESSLSKVRKSCETRRVVSKAKRQQISMADTPAGRLWRKLGPGHFSVPRNGEGAEFGDCTDRSRSVLAARRDYASPNVRRDPVDNIVLDLGLEKVFRPFSNDCAEEPSRSLLAKVKDRFHGWMGALLSSMCFWRAPTIQLFVKTMTGKTITFTPTLDATVAELKLMVQEKEGIPPDQQRLVFGGEQLEDSDSLRSRGIGKECTIHLVLRLRGSGPLRWGWENELPSSSFVRDLRREIAEFYRVAERQIHLTFNGQMLEDGKRLAEFEIVIGSVIDVFVADEFESCRKRSYDEKDDPKPDGVLKKAKEVAMDEDPVGVVEDSEESTVGGFFFLFFFCLFFFLVFLSCFSVEKEPQIVVVSGGDPLFDGDVFRFRGRIDATFDVEFSLSEPADRIVVRKLIGGAVCESPWTPHLNRLLRSQRVAFPARKFVLVVPRHRERSDYEWKWPEGSFGTDSQSEPAFFQIAAMSGSEEIAVSPLFLFDTNSRRSEKEVIAKIERVAHRLLFTELEAAANPAVDVELASPVMAHAGASAGSGPENFDLNAGSLDEDWSGRNSSDYCLGAFDNDHNLTCFGDQWHILNDANEPDRDELFSVFMSTKIQEIDLSF
jgi:hypothetical protein